MSVLFQITGLLVSPLRFWPIATCSLTRMWFAFGGIGTSHAGSAQNGALRPVSSGLRYAALMILTQPWPPHAGRMMARRFSFRGGSCARYQLILSATHRAQDAAASIASASNVRDDRETPLSVGRDGGSCKCDLGWVKTEIFLQAGLDRKFRTTPDGQISWRCDHRGGPMRSCGAVKLEDCCSCPGRGAASFTLLRRAGTHSNALCNLSL
jgi:hypothetical protein